MPLFIVQKEAKPNDAPPFRPIHRMRCDCVKSFRLYTPRAEHFWPGHGLLLYCLLQLLGNSCGKIVAIVYVVDERVFVHSTAIRNWRITCVTCGLCDSGIRAIRAYVRSETCTECSRSSARERKIKISRERKTAEGKRRESERSKVHRSTFRREPNKKQSSTQIIENAVNYRNEILWQNQWENCAFIFSATANKPYGVLFLMLLSLSPFFLFRILFKRKIQHKLEYVLSEQAAATARKKGKKSTSSYYCSQKYQRNQYNISLFFRWFLCSCVIVCSALKMPKCFVESETNAIMK